MLYIYKSSEIKKADRCAEEQGMTAFTLMELSGIGLFNAIKQDLNIHKHQFTIIAGKGNNGGDGIVLARYLQIAGVPCSLFFPLGLPVSAASKAHFDYYSSLGFSASTNLPDQSGSILVDSLFGIGIKLPLRENVQRVTDWMNRQTAMKVAIDLPTGAASDDGDCDKHAFKADRTYSLHGYKPSRFLYPAASLYGDTEVVEIGLPHTSNWKVRSAQEVAKSLTYSGQNAHKGTFGHGLLIAGAKDMPGSASLAASGAVACGAGKLTVQTEKEAIPIIASHVPEAMYQFNPHIELDHSFDAIAAGCGRPSDDKMEILIEELLAQNKPVILDAGALHPRSYTKKKCPVIVTPHPGEFSWMTGKETVYVQRTRIAAASAYAVEHNVTVVLKGEYTVTAFADGGGYVNVTGNDGLSKGGSGDVLTGLILALVLRNKNIKEAVADAVYLHGHCADRWKEAYPAQTMRPSYISQLIAETANEIIKET